MKRKMIGVLTMALAVSAVGTLGSCKDYDDDNRVEQQGEFAGLNKELLEWIEQVKKCQKTCADFRKYLVGDTKWTDENGNLVTIDRLGAFDTSIGNLETSVEHMQGILGYGDTENPTMTYKQLLELLADYSTVKTNANAAMDILGSISKEDFANNMSTIAQLNTTITTLTGAGGTIEELQGQINALREMKPGVEEERAKEIADSIANEKVKKAVEKLMGEGETDLTLNDINNALIAAEDNLQGEIDELRLVMKKFDKEIIALKQNFAQLVTGVIVQGTYNPIFGSLSAPVGLQSNVLAAYYGYAESAGTFPSSNVGMYPVGGNEQHRLTQDDIEMLGNIEGQFDFKAKDLLTDGNAGKIYLTVNPTNVDLDGVVFGLENSVGVASPVALSPLAKSYKKLTFGWTRSASDNGFYEADAVIAPEDIQKAKLVLDFNRNDLKEIFKDVTSPKDGINIMKIANTLYSAVNDVCDANAIKYTWDCQDVVAVEDSEGNVVGYKNAVGKSNSVLSQYNIAATAVKPLSFAFMKDSNIDTFWGVQRVKDFINNTINGISFNLNFGEIKVPEIKRIDIKPLETVDPVTGKKKYEKTVDISTTVTIEGQTIEVKLGDYINGTYDVLNEETGEKVGTIDLGKMFDGQTIKVTTKTENKTITASGTVDMTDIIKDVYGQVTDPIEDVNEMLGQLETFIGQVNDMLKEVNGINKQIEDVKGDIASQINKYIDALNKRLCNVINGINDRLQPLAIAHDGKEFYTLSEIKGMPTQIDGNTLSIVPTTYTAELVVPAYKKHIAVTNVFKGNANAQDGDTACLSALKAANNKGDMNKVLAGTTRNVEFAAEKGYVYEIAYTALDYSGKASTVKFYVTVK